ncbi:CDP-6-deoxy-delta-3,4-glucoseen reductase, partial [Burkholderiaceae bacterium]|nr:CDP-6-deoxy-delta-3,4-glucoseen reductase [Burkholderiaceae bacterium]
YVLTCCGVPTSDVVLESKQVTAEGALPIKKMPVRVAHLSRPSDDVALLRLQVPATEPFVYRAGQYVEFLLRDGDRRSYSMANAPHTQSTLPGIELHIRHMPGGKFTDAVFSTMKEKDILRIEGPYGSFYLREDSDKPMVFVASGTGFAPIKAILEHIDFTQSTRDIVVYWGGRRPADLYLHDWMMALAERLPNVRYIPVVSDATAADNWTGRTGFVHAAALADIEDMSGMQAYVCGAPIVVDAAKRDFVSERGLPEEAFFADSFTSAADTAQN